MKINIHKINNTNIDWKRELQKEHREVVIEASDLYPGIEIWYDRKVNPGIESGERVSYLITKDNNPVAAAIAKQGEDAKICSVRVRDEAMNEGFGAILFLLLAFSFRRGTKTVHFTAPDHLWNEYENFFTGMGFGRIGKAGEQYRLFDPEIVAEVDYLHFKKNVFEKYFARYAGQLSQINDDRIDVLLSIKPKYANRIINRTKIMELRRRFSKKWIGSSALIYASAPERAIVAKVRIAHVIKDKPIAVWNNWKDAIDCSEEEFLIYTKDIDEVYGILFGNVISVGPFYLTAMENKLEDTLTPPQSYLNLSINSKWERAIALSNMSLQNI
ncbi:MAG: hypothetical protein HQ591_10720 [candidate division Zixibacteria bacterium]|nr:hypothetical protein [Candidatus Tariuqbacter arcticus]